MTETNKKELIIAYEQLTTDIERWQFVFDHPSSIHIFIDNDDVLGLFSDEIEEEEPTYIFQLDNYGVETIRDILKSKGISAEFV